ncbi:response regulator [Abyssibacter profundi]|nr:response regulator [Abyssibacter profundi]
MKLLVIDDCPTDQALIRSMLSSACPESDISVAEDAVDLTSEQFTAGYDCVLLDYRLPSTTGLDLLAQARATAVQTPPVIMLSGESDLRLAVEAMKLGSSDFLPKQDLNSALLAEAISNAVRRARAAARPAHRHDPVSIPEPSLHLHDQALRMAVRQHIAGQPQSSGGCGLLVMDTTFTPAYGAPLNDGESTALLRQAEQRLTAALRAGDMVHRIGPGRVAILLAGCATEPAIIAARDRIRRRLMGPYPLTPTRQASARADIGMAVYPANGTNEAELIRHALDSLSEQRCICVTPVAKPSLSH